jgi:hypothetical protein
MPGYNRFRRSQNKSRERSQKMKTRGFVGTASLLVTLRGDPREVREQVMQVSGGRMF